MPLRSSLARSLQYAMANMADIKTPLCALQPTPAIPHTASRSGAGTRGGGERGLEAGAGTERASRQPPAPGGSRLGAPARRGLGGGRGARTPGAGRGLPLHFGAQTLTFSRSLPPRCPAHSSTPPLLPSSPAGAGAGKLRPHARASGRLRPRGRRARAPESPGAAREPRGAAQTPRTPARAGL